MVKNCFGGVSGAELLRRKFLQPLNSRPWPVQVVRSD